MLSTRPFPTAKVYPVNRERLREWRKRRPLTLLLVEDLPHPLLYPKRLWYALSKQLRQVLSSRGVEWPGPIYGLGPCTLGQLVLYAHTLYGEELEEVVMGFTALAKNGDELLRGELAELSKHPLTSAFAKALLRWEWALYSPTKRALLSFLKEWEQLKGRRSRPPLKGYVLGIVEENLTALSEERAKLEGLLTTYYRWGLGEKNLLRLTF